MANKDGDNSQSSSTSGLDSENNSENERNDVTIPSIPPSESPVTRGDNSEAIELFLEQVAATTTSTTTYTMNDSKKGRDKERELKKAKRMKIPPKCKCQLNDGQPCHTRFSVGELMNTRMHYMRISKKELDIAVLAKLECGIHLTKMTTRKKRKPTERKKHRTDFYHRGYRICNLMFVYLHGFSYKKLKALIIQYKTNGVKTRVHKSLKLKPLEIEVSVKKRKKKPKPKEPKPKKPRIKKCKEEKSAGVSSSREIKNLPQYQHISSPKLQQPLAPPSQPHHHVYPVSFPICNQASHPQPGIFMPSQHNSPPTFPQTMGYNSGSVFSPHPMAGHHPHPHPAVTSHNNPPLDYSSQPTLANPQLDFSNQRTNLTNMQTFQGASQPCLTYSVVHSVTF